MINFTPSFNEIYRLTKEDVTYHTITRTYDTYDDLIETESDSTISAVMEIIDSSSVQEFGGLLEIGDAIIYVLGTETINVNDKITHNSIKYKISKVIPMNSGSTIVFYEIHAKID